MNTFHCPSPFLLCFPTTFCALTPLPPPQVSSELAFGKRHHLIPQPEPILTTISLLLFQTPVFHPLCHSPNTLEITGQRALPTPAGGASSPCVWRNERGCKAESHGFESSFLRFSLHFRSGGESIQSHTCHERHVVGHPLKILCNAFILNQQLTSSPPLETSQSRTAPRERSRSCGAINIQIGERGSLRKRVHIYKYICRLWKETLALSSLGV